MSEFLGFGKSFKYLYKICFALFEEDYYALIDVFEQFRLKMDTDNQMDIHEKLALKNFIKIKLDK
jgi:hypothetical protein